MRATLAAVTLLLTTQIAQAQMLTKQSAHSVEETVTRFTSAIEAAGARVFATVDHAQGASNIGTDLAPMVAVIFGNPKIGTPLIAANPHAGLDLPLRVLVYEDAQGTTQMIWHDPAVLASDYGIDPDHPALKAMTGALEKLTGVASGL